MRLFAAAFALVSFLMAGPVAAQATPEAAYAAARAASPAPLNVDREHRDWLAERAVAGASVADTDADWVEHWRLSAESDVAARAHRVAPGALAQSCVPIGLTMGCETYAGGYLKAGELRLSWQLQEGASEENGVGAGFVLLAQGPDGLRPVAWGADGVHYDPPVVFWQGNAAYVAVAGVAAGTGRYNVDRLYRWTADPERPLVQVDNETWRDGLVARLPAGLEVWKGVAFDYEALSARTALWQADDGNCCPTGGEADLSFEIVDDALTLSGVEVDDPVFDFAMSTPTDVYDWIGRSLMCGHWMGEDGYDAERAAEIEAAVRGLRCEALDADAAALKTQYADSPDVLARIARTTAWGR